MGGVKVRGHTGSSPLLPPCEFKGPKSGPRLPKPLYFLDHPPTPASDVTVESQYL